MQFVSTRHPVFNRGQPPIAFLSTLMDWVKNAPDEIFAPNPNPADVYASTTNELGPWGTSIIHRKAGMLEVMRVHAGFESSWNWKEGVDRNNATSLTHKAGEETGIFQVSFNSLELGHGAMKSYAKQFGIDDDVNAFIREMKASHELALEYYARLVRVSIAWAGPLISRKLNPYLYRPAMEEFEFLLQEQ